MNLLFMTLLYPHQRLEEISSNCKDKVQYQIDHTQHAILKGLRSNLKSGEKLTVYNALPVGIYPLQYKKPFLISYRSDDGSYYECGSVNLPVFKQTTRKRKATFFLRKWLSEDPENREILIYTQYLPWSKAAVSQKKFYPDLKITIIVTDLPGKLGIPSGRKGVLASLEHKMGEQSLALLKAADRYVLLAEPMKDALEITKPYTVVEGIIDPDSIISNYQKSDVHSRKACLYTGTLDASLGINELLSAFEKMPEYELWLCGTGDCSSAAEAAQKSFPNIHYYGFVPREKAILLQQRADCLINPRKPDQLFTRYSFPSKTLEYLISGKPVLCYRLECFPREYDSYLQYISDNQDGIRKAVSQLLSLPLEERYQIGLKGRNFVLNNKNPGKQTEKILSLIREH